MYRIGHHGIQYSGRMGDTCQNESTTRFTWYWVKKRPGSNRSGNLLLVFMCGVYHWGKKQPSKNHHTSNLNHTSFIQVNKTRALASVFEKYATELEPNCLLYIHIHKKSIYYIRKSIYYIRKIYIIYENRYIIYEKVFNFSIVFYIYIYIANPYIIYENRYIIYEKYILYTKIDILYTKKCSIFQLSFIYTYT